MKSVYIFGILLIGFVVYWLCKDYIFEAPTKNDTFLNIPANAGIEIRQAPIYPERTVASSGPNPPNQMPPQDEVVVYADPAPKDPYSEHNQSSDIPEDLRYPERSFRPTPANNNTQIAVESGVASNNLQVNSNNSQQFSTDFIQSGGEFMPGIFANDTTLETNFSTF